MGIIINVEDRYFQNIRSNYLDKLEIGSLISKISKFRSLDLRYASDIEITQALTDVFFVSNENKTTQCCLLPQVMAFKPGSIFYRVRKHSNPKISKVSELFSLENDLWAPPSDKAKASRLNVDGESVLYTATEEYIAVEETRIRKGDYFTLIRYEATCDFNIFHLGWGDLNITDYESKAKLDLIYDFLQTEFTREVGNGTEHLYKISYIIGRKILGLLANENNIAGWAYPSAISKEKGNICFKEGAPKKTLKITGVLICKLESEKIKGSTFTCHLVGELNNKGEIDYYTIGSDKQKELFPTISQTG